ncbi:PDZ domain-containing protein [Hyphobacterium sp.]|jgi:hypothetical protein|uniref:PDZ domain-containing protein n=1 Tax=Hyphobacterium sp. TaxID=2004662 RepID=UPI003BAD1D91
MVRSAYHLLFIVFAALGHAQAADGRSTQTNARISIIEMPNAEWRISIDVPTIEMSTLHVRDMRHVHERCPQIEYEFLGIENAIFNGSAELNNGRLILRPAGQEPISIHYRIRATQSNLSHRVSDLAGCSAILQDQEYGLIDGRALLLAIRPFGLDGSPYRIGSTSLEYISDQLPLFSISNATPQESGQWHAERIDDYRFSFFAVGDWRSEVASNNATIPLTILRAGDTEPFSPDAIAAIGHAIDGFWASWGAVAAERYTAFLTPPSLDSESFGHFSGIAKPTSAGLYYGLGVSEQTLVFGLTHEIAHLWVPAQLGGVVVDTWIGEGLAELSAYIELFRAGYFREQHLVSRINQAILNTTTREVDLQLVYDTGILAWIVATERGVSDLIEHRFDPLFFALRDGAREPLSSERFWESAQRLNPSLSQYVGEVDGGLIIEHLPCHLWVNQQRFVLTHAEWPAHEMGWSLSESEVGIISEVIEGGPAEAAGLEAGDRVTQIETFGFGENQPSVTVLFERDGRQHSAKFFPHPTERTIRAPQYLPVSNFNALVSLSQCGNF